MSPFEHANVLPLGDGRLKHLQFVQAPLLLLLLREHLVQLRLLGQSLLHLLLEVLFVATAILSPVLLIFLAYLIFWKRFRRLVQELGVWDQDAVLFV